MNHSSTRKGRHAEKVVELAQFRESRVAPTNLPRTPPGTSRINVERDADGRFTYEYDVAPADAKSVMSICLMIVAKLLSKLPTAA